MLITEPAVLVPARWASSCAQGLTQLGRSNGGLSAGLAQLQAELRQAGAAWQRIQLAPDLTPETFRDRNAGIPQTGEGATLSVMEVAQLLACSDRNVRAMAARGSLPGHRHGGRWRFDPDDVAAWVADRRAS